VTAFELNRGQVVDRGVQAGRVVPGDPAGDLPLDSAAVGPRRRPDVDRLGLEQPDRRLAQRVVEGVASIGTVGRGRAARDPGGEKFGGERQRRVLAAMPLS